MTRWIPDVSEIDWSAFVRSGDRVIWGQASAEPVVLTETLMDQRSSIGEFTCFVGLQAADSCRPEHADFVRFESYTGAGTNGRLWEAGSLSILPIPYSDIPRLIESGRLHCDVVLLLLPPADPQGRYTMGLANEYLSTAIDQARIVIAAVSDEVPRIESSRWLTEQDLDVVVECRQSPVPLVPRDPTPEQHEVAANVAGLIQDGSTLQVGIGTLPDLAVRSLADHRDLGVHSGAFTDALAELTELGVVTNSYKTFDVGTSVAGALIGGNVLLRHVERASSLSLRPTQYTHDPAIMAGQYRFVSMNAALEVDLSGQVNAESVARRYLGAYGGASEFAAGARRSREGQSIVMLTAGTADTSRIVLNLSGPVSTPRGEVCLVVTEYGVADLRGRSIEERRSALIAVAHPAHRETLARA